MSIADYQPTKAEVAFKGGSLTVRGLALEDVATLMRTHLVDLDKLIAIFENGVKDDVAVKSFTQYAIQLAKEAPGLVANLIALACDDGDNVDAYRKLAMPIMLRAVEKIGELTFEESDGPKKFFGSLVQMIRAVRPVTGSLT